MLKEARPQEIDQVVQVDAILSCLRHSVAETALKESLCYGFKREEPQAYPCMPLKVEAIESSPKVKSTKVSLIALKRIHHRSAEALLDAEGHPV
jgi:hypothetical protein